MSALLKKKGAGFDGVFAASDLLAMGAIRALAEHSLRVPEDVSVIGYDDTPGAASFVPPLTSVHQYLRDGGVLLARKILGLIHGDTVALGNAANHAGGAPDLNLRLKKIIGKPISTEIEIQTGLN